jgi:hypothetical protein
MCHHRLKAFDKLTTAKPAEICHQDMAGKDVGGEMMAPEVL